jgi:hypothetical protein
MKRPGTLRAGRKSQLSPKPLSSSAVQPSSPAKGRELTEVQAYREALVSQTLEAATGIGANKYVAKRIFSQFSQMLMHGTDPETTLFLFAELRPGNVLESLLITQMIGTHEAALGFLKTSTADDLGQFRDQNVSRSTRLMRLFMDQLEQLRRLRGTTNQQKVTVEHVYVNAGGQAIVGAVVPPPVALPSAEPAEKLLQRPAVRQKTDG